MANSDRFRSTPRPRPLPPTSTDPVSLRALPWTFRFVSEHLPLVLATSLLAAAGRAAQLGGVGPIGSGWTVWIELVVEGARVLLFLGVIGLGHVAEGVKAVKHLIRQPLAWRAGSKGLLARLSAERHTLAFEVAGFGLIAFALNAAIRTAASEPAVLGVLRASGLIHATAGAIPVVFFLKNLTVIPLTIVFQYGLLLLLVGKMAGGDPPPVRTPA